MTKKNQTKIAYESILQDIKENRLAQGQPIIEEEYARKLNMSRTPVREAIRLLTVDDFISLYPRKGAYVKVLTRQDINDCYEMMEAIEGMIAYKAAKDPSEEDVNSLKELVLKMEQYKNEMNFHKWKEEDINFHRTLHKMSDNKLLVEHWEKLFQRTYQIQTSFTTVIDIGEATNEHRLIYQAFVDKNCQDARNYTEQNWRRARKDFLKNSNIIRE
jgi:DNA-binding GntR family transcriptional regulator